MFNVNNYLKKFSSLITSGSALKDIIIETIKTITGAVLTKSQIELKDRILHIKSRPIVKNTIYIRKQALIEELNKKGVVIKDII